VVHGRLLSWSLKHRRSRHAVNVIATAITALVVMVFVALVSQLAAFVQDRTGQDLERILVVPTIVLPGSASDGHAMSLLPTLQQIDGVKVVQRKRTIASKHPSGATYLVFGEEASGLELNKDFYPVDATTIEAWKRERIGAIVTEATARDLGLEVGTTTEVPTAFGPLQIKPIAITKGALFPQTIAVHFDYLAESSKNTTTCGYRVFTTPEAFASVAREIKELTKNSPLPAQGISSARFRARLAQRASALPIVVGLLGAFLIFTTALTLANNSAIAIRERRVEIATLRVIGYRRRTILAILTSEALVMGLASGLLAIGVGYLVFRNGVQLMPASIGVLPPLKIGQTALVAGAVAALVVPLVGTLPSALAATRMPLVRGLRETP
jgi:ABC-type lipoprotein release transport system permease subunit